MGVYAGRSTLRQGCAELQQPVAPTEQGIDLFVGDEAFELLAQFFPVELPELELQERAERKLDRKFRFLFEVSFLDLGRFGESLG